MKPRLWTKDFTRITLATAMGAAGGIAGGFALSFLVFDQTGSTLAAALIVAIQLVPQFILPLFIAPHMDRMPRKPFLVGGDLLNGVIYALMGCYLLRFSFSYVGYLAVSLLLACLGSFDQLAYESIYPSLIPEGMEQKGYAVSSMLYPLLRVLMMPLGAVLMDTLGVPLLLVLQGGLSVAAAGVSPAGARPVQHLCLYGGDKRCRRRLRPADGRVLPHDARHDGAYVCSVFRCGISRPHAGRRGAVSRDDPAETKVFVRVLCLSGL